MNLFRGSEPEGGDGRRRRPGCGFPRIARGTAVSGGDAGALYRATSFGRVGAAGVARASRNFSATKIYA